MFELVYLADNDGDEVGRDAGPQGRFETYEAARAALLEFRAQLRPGSSCVPERCIVLAIPNPVPVVFQIVYYDAIEKATWAGLSVHGRRHWKSEKLARFWLGTLQRRLRKKHGPSQLRDDMFEVRAIPLSALADIRPTRGRNGRRILWKLIDINEETGTRRYRAYRSTIIDVYANSSVHSDEAVNDSELMPIVIPD
jgi:hypothetical protein